MNKILYLQWFADVCFCFVSKGGMAIFCYFGQLCYFFVSHFELFFVPLHTNKALAINGKNKKVRIGTCPHPLQAA